MRLLIFELRPPELAKIGLSAALQARLDSVEMRGGIQTELHVDGVYNPDVLPRAAEDELYRMAQEALNNILKHAGAQHVWIDLCFSGMATRLSVRDDGTGFDPSAGGNGGLGLASLRERAQKLGASLEIKSAPRSGTRVIVIVPGSSPAEANALS
jgi:signal transduction histidine kinase